MILNDKTVIIKVEASACGYYSGATEEGHMFLPKEIITDEEIKDISNIKMFVYGLDGKHSEDKVEINVIESNIKDIFKKENYGEGLNEKIDEEIFGIIMQEDKFNKVSKFDSLIKRLINENKKIENVKLEEDLSVGNKVIPIGTEIRYSLEIDTKKLEINI